MRTRLSTTPSEPGEIVCAGDKMLKMVPETERAIPRHLTARSLLLSLCLMAACAGAQVQTPGPGAEEPALNATEIVAADGYRMPLSRWQPDGETERVVLALHGFNDFRQSHAVLGKYLADRGTVVYAYDQRGFGGTEQRGIWPGSQALVADASLVLRLLRARYPDKELFLLGESMGAAVAILALAETPRPDVSGAILMAPAVWARDTQPWYQRLGLWLGLRLTPGMKLSADWVAVEPTDDPEWADYWDEHPLVIHKARVDALDGLTELMGAALSVIGENDLPSLILYGGEDEVVPPDAICAMLSRIGDTSDNRWRYAFYPDGWHFLTRDSRARETLEDIESWLEDQGGDLPSGRGMERKTMQVALCP